MNEQKNKGKLGGDVCRRCLDGDSAPVVLLSEVELEPGVNEECVSKFCYLGYD